MRDRAILIGVGGTGCKCLESVVHVAAAGLMKADCELLFIDQDKSNQCTTRARRVAQNYIDLLEKLDRSVDPSQASPIFQTRLAVRGDVLQPLPKNDSTLQGAFSVAGEPRPVAGEDDDAWLMRALFSEQERTDQTNNGFRARPAVGAAAYTLAVAQATERAEAGTSMMWGQIVAAIQDALGANPGRVSVVLLGSIFGGTGAAGLPSIGQRVRRIAREAKAGHLDVSAVLMLPYYNVEPPGGVADPYGPVPSGQVRLALEHYDRLMRGPEDERPFDSIRLVGLAEFIEVPYDPLGGGSGQDNAPLAPELIGALGAAHVLAQTPHKSSVYYCMREQQARMTLRDLPTVGPSLPPPGKALIDLMRCGFAYLCAYYPIIWNLSRGKTSLLDYPFLRAYLTKKDLEGSRSAFDQARIYFQNLFSWAAALETHYPGHTLSHNRFADHVAIEFFAAANFAETEPSANPHLKYDMNGAEANPPAHLDSRQIDAVKHAFRAFEADALGLEMHVVLERLASGASERGRGRGSRSMIEAIYRASVVEVR